MVWYLSKYLKSIRIISFLTLSFFSQVTFSQESDIKSDSIPLDIQIAQDSLITDSTYLFIQPKIFPYEIALYGDLSYEYAPQYSGYSYSRYLGLGAVFEGWSIGGFYNTFKDDKNAPFFPRLVHLELQHVGGFVSKSILRSNLVRINTRLNASYGNLIWKNQENKTEEFSDHFYLLKPEIEATLTLFSTVQLVGAVGYRLPIGVELPALPSNTHKGICALVGIRIGYFHKPSNHE